MRSIVIVIAMAAALAVAGSASARGWHNAGNPVQFQAPVTIMSQTVVRPYEIRAQVWRDTPTGAGMAVRNAYVARLQGGALFYGGGIRITLTFRYREQWYTASVGPMGRWLWVTPLCRGALPVCRPKAVLWWNRDLRWLMRIKVRGLGWSMWGDGS